MYGFYTMENISEIIARFFNDLIGSFVPSIFCVFIFTVSHFGINYLFEVIKNFDGQAGLLICLSLLFALGQLIAAIQYAVDNFLTCCSTKFSSDSPTDKDACKVFERILKEKYNYNDLLAIDDLRNIAMSISLQAGELGRRFMFIALLCKRMAVIIFILIIDFLLSNYLHLHLFYYDYALSVIAQVLLLTLAGVLLYFYGNSFEKRAKEVPFSIAIAELKFKMSGDGSA